MMNRFRLLLTIVMLLIPSAINAYELIVRPEEFNGNSMSEKIQSALDRITENGGGTILFRDTPVYLIDKAIALPSSTTMVIDNCKIKLADHVFDNIIRSANIVPDDAHPFEYALRLDEGHDISIVGKGEAVVEGAEDFYADVNPKTGKYEKWLGDFWGWRNFSILMSYVHGFKVTGITLQKTHSWGMVFTNGCTSGLVSDIVLHTTVKNGDGISIIQGGSDIIIQNVTGETSDDSIVLAAFDESRWSNQKYVFPLLPVRYSDYSYGADIHDITIRNVHVSGIYHDVIFLPSRPQIYDVRCENISDGDKGGKNVIVRFYGNGQYGKGFKPGNVHHVYLDGITSNYARATVEILAPLFDCCFDNLVQDNPRGVVISEPEPQVTSRKPDCELIYKVPRKGLYKIYADVRRLDQDDIRPGVPVPTRYVTMQINDSRPTTRIISDLDHYTGHWLGNFSLKRRNTIRLWLPEMIEFDSLRIEKYRDIVAPREAYCYKPSAVPPSSHPRIWVTPRTIDQVRSKLDKGENARYWAIVKETAKSVYPFRVNAQVEEFYNPELEDVITAKAFYSLMTGDEEVGRESVSMLKDYLSVLEYGNVRRGDITRQIGKTIFTTSVVSDWCYNLISHKDLALFHDKSMSLARIMEVGWPPFLENVVNGHASEAQVNRDLLSMALAFYEIDNDAYRLVAYQMNQIERMRAFEYQSPRHNQGYDYGVFRHGWEMRAAWMLRRMTGKPFFDDNIKNLCDYWIHMRLPGGDRFADGDRFPGDYKMAAETFLLDYSYSENPYLKTLFSELGGYECMEQNPILFLLVNDPNLAPKPLSELPRSIDYGDVLGGQTSRTGWDLSEESKDVFFDIRGGGYSFGNHQHSDAGSFQLFCRGRIITNVGIYMAYGTPYDYNFNKRSISHNTVLVMDPDEELVDKTKQNDGGSRFNQVTPHSPEETVQNPLFAYGTVLSVASENAEAPSYWYKADLTDAYSSKIARYTRSSCFLDLSREDVPAAIIIDDNISTTGNFKTFWKVNTLCKPVASSHGVKLQSFTDDEPAFAFISPLNPSLCQLVTEVSSIKDSSSILGPQYQIRYPRPETKAYQFVENDCADSKNHRYLNLIQVTRSNASPLPVTCTETGAYSLVCIADRAVLLSRDGFLHDDAVSFVLSQEDNARVLVTDLKPGKWILVKDGKEIVTVDVKDRDNTASFSCGKGSYSLFLRS